MSVEKGKTRIERSQIEIDAERVVNALMRRIEQAAEGSDRKKQLQKELKRFQNSDYPSGDFYTRTEEAQD